jgi:hypothetical protein
MRTGLALVAAALLCSVAAPAPASAATVRTIIHRVEARVEGAIFAAHVRAAAREWKQLPPAELACADQALKERGQSVEGLARKGVSPNHPRLAELRKQCTDAAKLAAAGQMPGQLPQDPAQLAAMRAAMQQSAMPTAAQQAAMQARGQQRIRANYVEQPATKSEVVQPSEKKTTESESATGPIQTIEKLQTDLAAAQTRIAELETAKRATDVTLNHAEQARRDVEDAKQVITAEKADLEAALAQVISEKRAAEAENGRRERLAYGGIVGLLAVLAALTGALFMSRQKARSLEQRLSKQQAAGPAPALSGHGFPASAASLDTV